MSRGCTLFCPRNSAPIFSSTSPVSPDARGISLPVDSMGMQYLFESFRECRAKWISLMSFKYSANCVLTRVKNTAERGGAVISFETKEFVILKWFKRTERKESVDTVAFSSELRQVESKKMYSKRGEKRWRGEANDINYRQSPGLKYPKNSRICSWTETPVVGPGTKWLLFKQGILPISCSSLTDPRRIRLSFYLLSSSFSFVSLSLFFLLSPMPFLVSWSSVSLFPCASYRSIVAIIFHSLSRSVCRDVLCPGKLVTAC